MLAIALARADSAIVAMRGKRVARRLLPWAINGDGRIAERRENPMYEMVTLDPLARRLTATNADDVARIARSLRYRRTLAEQAGRDALATWHDALLVSVSACGLMFRETRRVALAALPSRDLATLIVDYGRELAQTEVLGGPLTDVTSTVLAELREEMRRRQVGATVGSGSRLS